MRVTFSILLLASFSSTFGRAVEKRQEATSTTLTPISVNTEVIATLQAGSPSTTLTPVSINSALLASLQSGLSSGQSSGLSSLASGSSLPSGSAIPSFSSAVGTESGAGGVLPLPIATAISSIQSSASSVVSSIESAASSILSGASSTISSAASGISSAASSAVGGGIIPGGNLSSGISAISSVQSSAASVISSVASSASGAVAGGIGGASSQLSSGLSQISSVQASATSAISGAASSATGAIVGGGNVGGASSSQSNGSGAGAASGNSATATQTGTSTQTGLPNSIGTGVFAAPVLPSASSMPFARNCPEGYTQGDYNARRELQIRAKQVSFLLANFNNMTWMEGSPVMQTGGLDRPLTMGQYAGSTRMFTVNGVEMAETLTNYNYEPQGDGYLRQIWVLSNGPLFNDELAGYSSTLILGPQANNGSASQIDWNTSFCAKDQQKYQDFFSQIVNPPLDFIRQNAV